MGDTRVRVVSPGHLEGLGIRRPENTSDRGGVTRVFVVANDKLIVSIALSDSVRPESYRAIEELQDRSGYVAMTGDGVNGLTRACAGAGRYRRRLRNRYCGRHRRHYPRKLQSARSDTEYGSARRARCAIPRTPAARRLFVRRVDVHSPTPVESSESKPTATATPVSVRISVIWSRVSQSPCLYRLRREGRRVRS